MQLSIRGSLLKILQQYPAAKANAFAKHPLASFIRDGFRDAILATPLKTSKFLIKGSAGQGNWARGPWLAIFNPIITTSAQFGYYPVYLFREDMAGVYLSINQAMTENKTLYKADAKTVLKAKAQNYRAMIGHNTGRFSYQDIDLAPSTASNDTAFYEAGNITSVYYSLQSIPDEETLINDLHNVLILYDQLLESEALQESEPTSDEVNILNSKIYIEDTTKLKLHKRIERNIKLTQKAKLIHGYKCQSCGFDFEKKYGEIGRNYIEAHHLFPLSMIKNQKVKMDPKTDFAVLCSNCHRMIHKTSLTHDIPAFQKLIQT